MLIDYSERAHELLVGPLNAEAKDDLYDVFFRVGTGLGIRWGRVNRGFARSAGPRFSV